MNEAVELNELMERIRQSASRENGLAGGPAEPASAATELPPVPEPLPLPPSPVSVAAAAGDPTRPETLLDEADSMLTGGRKKNAVSAGVPKLLRQFFRNQGGVNSVVMEAVERLVEVNRNLRRQNYDLHERMMDFHAWAHSVVEASAETHGWMRVADARLRPFGESRFAQVEERLARLEERAAPRASAGDPAASPVLPSLEARLAELATRSEALEGERLWLAEQIDQLRVQVEGQAAYIRSVHGHLDQLGAHVDARLAEG